MFADIVMLFMSVKFPVCILLDDRSKGGVLLLFASLVSFCCILSLNNVLFCVEWRGVAWHGVAWRGVAWCGAVRCSAVWCGAVRC